MKKTNVEKLEIMAQDFLQYRYCMFCMGRRHEDWLYYQGACGMIEAFGGTWMRNYKGGNTEDDENNPNNYSHTVIFPSDDTCNRLNEDAWK